VLLVGTPRGFDLGTLPTGALLAKRSTGNEYDVVVVFVKQKTDLVKQVDALRPKMTQAGGLWIAWPKKSSGVPTDIVEDTIRGVALPTGLVDNKVCAIDETWSGLRLVIRKANRVLSRTPSRASTR